MPCSMADFRAVLSSNRAGRKLPLTTKERREDEGRDP